MNLFKKSFLQTSILFLGVFIFSFLFNINNVSAAITTTVKIDGVESNKTVTQGSNVTVSWTSTEADSCAEGKGRGGTGQTGSFTVNSIQATETFTVNCTRVDPSITETLNTPKCTSMTGKQGGPYTCTAYLEREQAFNIGSSVLPGDIFNIEVYSHIISTTAVAGDTAASIMVKLKNAVGATTEAQWNDHASAPKSGTVGFKPTTTRRSDTELGLVLDFQHQFAAWVTPVTPTGPKSLMVTVNPPNPPSGRLYVTPTCIIEEGQSGCSVYVTWIAISHNTDTDRTYLKIIRNNPDDTFFSGSRWGTTEDSATQGNTIGEFVNYGVSNFKLYYKDNLLPQGNDNDYSVFSNIDAISKLFLTTTTNVTTTASCVSGTSWNGEKCVTPTPSGSISATDCTIALNASTCPSSVSWSSSNIVSGSSFAVTHNNPDNTSVSSSKNDTKNVSITNGFTDFYIYNSNVKLASTTATASCVSGSSWDSSSKKCKASTVTPITVSISANPAGPLTATGSTTLTWTTTNSPDSCAASNSWSGDNKTSSGGSESRTGMAAGTYNFDITCKKAGLSDAVDSVAVVVNAPASTTATCSDGIKNQNETSIDTGGACGTCSDNIKNGNETSTDIGGRCATGPSGTLSATNCIISIPKASTCTSKVTWTTSNLIPGKDTAVTRNNLDVTVSTATSGNDVSNIINHGDSTFYLYHNGVALKNSPVTASCDSTINLVWDAASKACEKTNPTPSGTLSATSCTIAQDKNTCSSKVTWTTSNLIPGKDTAVTRNNPDVTVSTATSGNDVSNIINHGDSTFYLYHNGVALKNSPVTATCFLGTAWDATKLKCVKDTVNKCTNPQATNYPECTIGGNGKCLNGAINPPTCTIGPDFKCLNGAIDSPTCLNQTPIPGFWSPWDNPVGSCPITEAVTQNRTYTPAQNGGVDDPAGLTNPNQKRIISPSDCPTVNIKAERNSQELGSTEKIPYNGKVNINWISSKATSCSCASKDISNNLGVCDPTPITNTTNPTAPYTSPALKKDTTYTVTCENQYGMSMEDFVLVPVYPINAGYLEN